jgi:UDP-2-acetamido-2-deoxy-ribo-hexuluronate aminotransferase
MQTIHMSDIYGQYLTMKEEIDAAMQQVIKSTLFIKSGKAIDFEKKLSAYLNTNVIGCANGTDALQIAFMALGLQPGDEVITTPFTFIATVEVLALLGLKPVFVDVCPNKYNIDSSKIEDRQSPIKPKPFYRFIFWSVCRFGNHTEINRKVQSLFG